MIAAADINITKVETSKLNDINLTNIPFGKYFTDHMLGLIMKMVNGKLPK
jgi:branched-chain amino acid aminotransferase